MNIDQEKCINCAKCLPFCPVSAIVVNRPTKKIVIDEILCVECGVCFRSGICPTDAFVQNELTWPRSVRAALSNPLIVNRETRIPGRGTEEMKTNDITGRFKPGHLGIAVEMGRPGTGATFVDIQKVAQLIAAHDVIFAAENPITFLMINKKTGEMNPEVMKERVLSGIIEFEIPVAKADELLQDIKKIAKEIDTIFSLDVISYVEKGGQVPMFEILGKNGFSPSPNGKNNMGLGKPLYEFYPTKETR
jgi:NAD-dependent dihydropyrimidine dehydrogenase PreA subunit